MYEVPKFDRLLVAEDFAPWVGAMFRLETEPEPVSIQLVELTRRPRSPLSHREPFSLMFRSTWNVLLVDGIYRMRCGRFGPHEIALTPITPEPPTRIYQAVFG